MLRILVMMFVNIYRGEKESEEIAQEIDETNRLRQEHRERMAGIPPHLRSTNFKRRRRPRSNSELLGKSALIVGIACAVVFGLCFFLCVGGALINGVVQRANAPGGNVVVGPAPPPARPAPPAPPGPPPEPKVAAFRTLKTKAPVVFHIRFTRDGNRLATFGGQVGPHYLQLWDRESGAELASCEEGGGGIGWLEISPDGKHVLAYHSDKIILRDSKTGSPEGQIDLRGEDQAWQTVSFAPDSSTVTLSQRKGLAFWAVPDGTRLPPLAHVEIDQKTQEVIAQFTPDGKTLLTSGWLDERGGRRRHDQVWDLTGKNPVRELKGFSQTIKGLGGRLFLSPDGKLALLASSETMEVLDWQTDRKLAEWKASPGQEKWGLAFVPGGKHIVTGHRDCTIRCWDLETLTVVGNYQDTLGASDGVSGVAVSPDGQLLATALGDTISLRRFDEVFPKK